MFHFDQINLLILGLGPDPAKPPCKKSKLRKLEKHQEKLKHKTNTGSSGPKAGSRSTSKSLEEFIVDAVPGQDLKHRLEVIMQ